MLKESEFIITNHNNNIMKDLYRMTTDITKKSYQIIVPPNNKYYIPLKISFSDKTAPILLNINENNILTFYKNKIDKYEYNKCWDNYKKYSNEYELIHISTLKCKLNYSIAYYIPLSRSYFKLWEIITDFNLLNYNYNIKTAHLAEGPGGFVEAVVNYRKKKNIYNDKLYAITLKSSEKEIPGWKKSEKFLKKNNNVNITYGKDGTGNIYKLENILHFVDIVGKNDCEFITADGGFDFSIDFNKQEQLSYQLIFCQIVVAISVQKKGGSFICKIFDSYSQLTIKFLWLLNTVYESITITKPLTSRPANSEKYIVAQNFKGIDQHYLNNLYLVVDQWYNNNDRLNVIDIFQNNVPDCYNTIIENYNNYILYKQLKNIIKTLELIKVNDENNEEIIVKQVNNAINWCLKYHIEINYKSKYLTTKNKYYINQYLKYNSFYNKYAGLS